MSRLSRPRLASFTAVYPGGLWNIQLATLGDDPQEIDLEKAKALCSRSENICKQYEVYILPTVSRLVGRCLGASF